MLEVVPMSPVASLPGALAQVQPATQPAAQVAAPAAQPAAQGGAPTTATTSAATKQAEPAQQSSGSPFTGLLFPVLIFVAFYFLLIRPQQKKAKDLDSKLKKGDRVFTNSGLIGKILMLSDKRATIEIAAGVKVEMLRSAIGGLDEGEAERKANEDAKNKDGKDKIDAKVAEAKK